MKLLKYWIICCVFIFFSQGLYAEEGEQEIIPLISIQDDENQSAEQSLISTCKKDFCLNSRKKCCASCPFADAGFFTFGEAQWYALSVANFPGTTVLSRNRNTGFSHGDILLTPTGVTINSYGSYFVNFSTIINNPGVDPVILALFLTENETLDLSSMSTLIGTTLIIPSGGAPGTVNASGILKDVKPGTRISILISNVGNQSIEPQIINIIRWDINLFKISE